MRKHSPIPKTFVVQPLRKGQKAVNSYEAMREALENLQTNLNIALFAGSVPKKWAESNLDIVEDAIKLSE